MVVVIGGHGGATSSATGNRGGSSVGAGGLESPLSCWITIDRREDERGIIGENEE